MTDYISLFRGMSISSIIAYVHAKIPSLDRRNTFEARREGLIDENTRKLAASFCKEEDALGPRPKTVPPVRAGGALVMDPVPVPGKAK
jgi:hypothetical protein